MELRFLRGNNWIYFNAGKYWIAEDWYEIRIAIDFYSKRIHFSWVKVFKEGKLNDF